MRSSLYTEDVFLIILYLLWLFNDGPSPPRRDGEGPKYRNHKTIFRSRLVRFDDICSCPKIWEYILPDLSEGYVIPRWNRLGKRNWSTEKKSHFKRTARPQHAKTFSYLGSKKRVDFKMLKWTLFFAPQMAKYLKKIKMPFDVKLKYK